MVGIGIDDDLVGIPEPAIAISYIKGSHAPIEVVEPKTARVAAGQTPYVTASEAAIKAPMLEGMIQMEVSGTAALIMTNPLAVGMHVGSFRMALNVLLRSGVTAAAGMRSRTMSGNETAADVTAASLWMTATTMLIAVLRKRE